MDEIATFGEVYSRDRTNRKRKRNNRKLGGGTCVFCGSPTSATIHDFKFDEERTRVDYEVCANHLVLLALCHLPKADVQKLRGLVDGEVFYTHGDFYDEDGEALQPKG